MDSTGQRSNNGMSRMDSSIVDKSSMGRGNLSQSFAVIKLAD